MGGMVCLAGGMVCLAGGIVCLAGGMVCLAGGMVCQFDHDASKEISAYSTSKAQTAEVTHRHLYITFALGSTTDCESLWK